MPSRFLSSASEAPVPTSPRATLARLLVFVGVSLVSLVVVPALVYPFFRVANAVVGARLIGYGVLTASAMLVATTITLRIFREPWGAATRLGRDALQSWPLLGGFAAGWFAIAVPALVLIWLGALRIIPADPGSVMQGALLAIAMLAPSALTEELALRGYGFTLLQRAWGTPVAVGVTSVLFGVLHLFNPGVSAWSVMIVAFAGVYLAVVRLAFNSLWAAWVAHFAFNFVQVAVLHAPVSGVAIPQADYQVVSAGPEWLTGGAWGPEAGVAAAAGMLCVIFLLAVHAGWVHVDRRGWKLVVNWRPDGRGES